jgi:hypothetical protein
VSSTDRSVPEPDEPGGAPDQDAPGSRARVAGHGWLPWAAGAGLVLAQVLVAVILVAPGHWRTAGALLLVAVTLVGVGVAVLRD